jgi:sugar/nucleoside kinase (ribokinase family)
MPQIVTAGEALVEIMRTERDRPLSRPAAFSGPYPSGAPAIFASAAARLGASAGFVGSVGQDAFGDCIMDRLMADGIDCSAVRRVHDRLTGIAFVAYRSDGGRSFVFHMAASAAVDVNVEQIPPGYLDGVRYLHVMGSSLSAGEELRLVCYAAAAAVHAQGGTVSLDPNLRPELLPVDEIRDVCEPILRVADIVLPSGQELTTLTGAATPEDGVARLLERGVGLVALKRGAEGSTLYTRDETVVVPPYSVDEVDPTGAGDCYGAALLFGLGQGWPIAQAGLLANAAGALATTRLGPMEGTFGLDEVREFMAAQGRPLDVTP